jgi:ribonuclease-3
LEVDPTVDDTDALIALCTRLGYRFRDLALLEQALRHTSYSHEHPGRGPSNQRLEFLGDAALGLVVAEKLVLAYPDAREGDLTRWRAALVSEGPLSRRAREVGLGPSISLGRGEDAGGGRDRPSLLSDTFEAVVGAAFLDGGLDAVRSIVSTVMGERIERIARIARQDPKSKVQEKIQSVCPEGPVYRLVRTTGPDHARRFEVEVTLGDQVLGRGEGQSKKSAEKAAAIEALEHLSREEES